MYRKYVIIFLILISFIKITGQSEVGVIYSRSDAQDIFGKVDFSIGMNTDEIKQILSSTSKVIMFKIYNQKLVILGDERKVLLNQSTYNINNVDEFRLFSKSKLEELLMKGLDKYTFIELRNGVLTISNNAYTLEDSVPCPPYCE
tara:strand:- start:117 stop:551 length:435 start_codon:yes stop_codon:yes gene_type:complete